MIDHPMTSKKGLLIVNTGDGKGKTTASLGLVLRAWGRGFRICVIQFIKSETGKWGEVKAAEKLGIEWHASLKIGTNCRRTSRANTCDLCDIARRDSGRHVVPARGWNTLSR